MNLIKAITTVGGFTLLSRVFGFVRDILIANFLGAGMVADAFVVAFRLPNLFRRLFAEGAFAAAFVPLFFPRIGGRRRGSRPRTCARIRGGRLSPVLALVLVGLVIVMELAMPWVMVVMAGGFQGRAGPRWPWPRNCHASPFPTCCFISLVSLQSGVLNSLGRFAAAAAAPVLLNITLITALLAFSHRLESAGHALSWGVFAAGLIQFLWLAHHCRKAGFPLRLVRPPLDRKSRASG